MIKTVLIFLLVDILLAHEGHIQANSLNQTISSLDTSGTDIPAPLVFTNRTNEEKKSVPRKGTPGVIKARKGAILEEPETDVSSSTTSTVAPSNVTTIKFHNKPTAASEGAADEDSDSSHPDYTALIVGLSLGIGKPPLHDSLFCHSHPFIHSAMVSFGPDSRGHYLLADERRLGATAV